MTALILVALLQTQDTAQTEGKVTWFKDYGKALTASKDTGKPIFIFFGCC